MLSFSTCRLILHDRILDRGSWITRRHWSIAYKVRLRESSLFGHSTEIGTSSNHLRNPSEFLLHYWESYKRFVAIHVLSLVTSDRSSLPRPGLIWHCRPEDVILVPETLGKLRFQLLWASGILAWPSKTRRKRMYRGGDDSRTLEKISVFNARNRFLHTSSWMGWSPEKLSFGYSDPADTPALEERRWLLHEAPTKTSE